MSCKYERAIRAVSETIAAAVEQVDYTSLDFPEIAENPAGLVLVVYCRDCDCTHASLFEPDGAPLGASKKRALNALRVAATVIESEVDLHGKEETDNIH